MSKSSKSCPVKVYRKRVIRSAKGIDTHVELPASKKQGIEEISLADVWLGRIVPIE